MVKPKDKKKKNPHNKEIKPFMDFLGIVKYDAFKIDYYSGTNTLFLIETDFLETFILKIFDTNEYKYAASIEKHFIVNTKNISKLTPTINVAHDQDDNLGQFLFTNRLPGGIKKWTKLDAKEKSDILKDIAKVMYKVHTYTSTKTLKKVIYGKVSDSCDSWNSFLKKAIELKISNMKDEKSEIKRFEEYCLSKLTKIAGHNIKPSLLHGSINLNANGEIRSLLFLGSKISAVINSEESIYGDPMWDIVKIYSRILKKDTNHLKDFNAEYGKFTEEQKERLEFYEKIIS